MMDIITTTNYQLTPNRTVVPPTVDGVLEKIGPFMPEALFLGMCSDDQPAAVKMDDANMPFLVTAPEGWGKTHLLKTTLLMGKLGRPIRERTISAIVLTNRRGEWDELKGIIQVVDLTSSNAQTVMSVSKYDAGKYEYGLVFVDGWEHEGLSQFIDVMGQLRKVVTIITTRRNTVPLGVTRIWEGFCPGQFQTVEGDRPLFFHTPSL